MCTPYGCHSNDNPHHCGFVFFHQRNNTIHPTALHTHSDGGPHAQIHTQVHRFIIGKRQNLRMSMCARRTDQRRSSHNSCRCMMFGWKEQLEWLQEEQHWLSEMSKKVHQRPKHQPSNMTIFQKILRCEDGKVPCPFQTSCLFSGDRKWDVNYDVSSSSRAGDTPTHKQPANTGTTAQVFTNATRTVGRRDKNWCQPSQVGYSSSVFVFIFCSREGRMRSVWVWE